jgi:hypothetical protein
MASANVRRKLKVPATQRHHRERAAPARWLAISKVRFLCGLSTYTGVVHTLRAETYLLCYTRLRSASSCGWVKIGCIHPPTHGFRVGQSGNGSDFSRIVFFLLPSIQSHQCSTLVCILILSLLFWEG